MILLSFFPSSLFTVYLFTSSSLLFSFREERQERAYSCSSCHVMRVACFSLCSRACCLDLGAVVEGDLLPTRSFMSKEWLERRSRQSSAALVTSSSLSFRERSEKMKLSMGLSCAGCSAAVIWIYSRGKNADASQRNARDDCRDSQLPLRPSA